MLKKLGMLIVLSLIVTACTGGTVPNNATVNAASNNETPAAPMTPTPVPIVPTPTSIASGTIPIQTTPGSPYKLYGVDFWPFTLPDDNSGGHNMSEAQITRALDVVAPHTEWVNIGSVCDPLNTPEENNNTMLVAKLAHQRGLKVAVKIPSAFYGVQEYYDNCFIQLAGQTHVDMAIVGGDNKELNYSTYTNYLENLRSKLPNTIIAVSYYDTENLPTIIAHADVVLDEFAAPTRDESGKGTDIRLFMALLNSWYNQVIRTSQNKPVLVTLGWAWSEDQHFGGYLATQPNGAYLLMDFTSWARARNVGYFYHEAFDTPDYPLYHHYGIWDKHGQLVPGMDRTLSGESVADNWSVMPIDLGPKQIIPPDASIQITYVPPANECGTVGGDVANVNPADFRVRLYIRVRGGWYVKPYESKPDTDILPDGSWSTDMCTGGVDSEADRFRAFLIPITYILPVFANEPEQLNEYPSTSVDRNMKIQ